MKLAITGDAYVLTSTLKAADIQLVKKHQPDALKIKDKDGNDIFALGYNQGSPCISKCGVTFGGTSRDGGEFATITGTLPAGTTNAKEYVADLVGSALQNINKLEATLPEVIETIKRERRELLDAVVVG